jgi:putative hydrolase of HD superfamily
VNENDSIIRFFFEAGQLKRTPRSGWMLAGVKTPESVAEHSFRVGVIAYVIATVEGANADRAAALGLFHDLPETRIGDVPSVGKSYVTTADPRQVAVDQAAGLPAVLFDHIVALVAEHENAKTSDATLEARCSRDADKLECLLQAREYEAATGNQQLKPWIDSMLRAVTTTTGTELAKTAMVVEPSTWFRDFAVRFGLPRIIGE